VDVTIRDAESADHSRVAELLSVAYAEYLRFGDEEPGWIDYVAEQPGGNVKILAYRLDLDPWSRTGHAR
jgi:hypothetical protein